MGAFKGREQSLGTDREEGEVDGVLGGGVEALHGEAGEGGAEILSESLCRRGGGREEEQNKSCGRGQGGKGPSPSRCGGSHGCG